MAGPCSVISLYTVPRTGPGRPEGSGNVCPASKAKSEQYMGVWPVWALSLEQDPELGAASTQKKAVGPNFILFFFH